MLDTSKVRSLGRALLLVVLLCLVFTVFVAAKSRDARPVGDKDKPWYRGKENLENLFIQKKDLPKAPLLDYSQDCMLCHNKYYDKWWESGHSTAYNNAFFQDAWQHYREWWTFENNERRRIQKEGKIDGTLKKGMVEQPEWALELSRTDCLSCHAPSINATIKYTDSLELRNILLAMREGYVPTWDDIVSGYLDKDQEFDLGATYFDEVPIAPSLDITMRQQVRFLQRISDYTKDGVSCDFCHTVTRLSLVSDRSDELHRMQNMNYSLNFEHRFGMKKWGPIEETPTASHTIQYSPIYKESEFCASCHQEVNDFGIKIQDTYNEWKYSEWARKGVTCQNCHMPEYRSVVSKHGQIRDDAHDHSFLGIDDDAFLASAAELEISAERNDDNIAVSVNIINNGTGHALPTGVPFRRVVLVVRAKDELGNSFWQDIKEFGRIVKASYPNIYEDTDEVPYWMADTVVEDTRIMPNETRELTFTVPAADQPGAVYVTAQLFYRRAGEKYGSIFNLVDPPETIAGMGITVQ